MSGYLQALKRVRSFFFILPCRSLSARACWLPGAAHRRARKCVGALEEAALALEEAFADAAGKRRPVLEAVVLLGASHLSPK